MAAATPGAGLSWYDPTAPVVSTPKPPPPPPQRQQQQQQQQRQRPSPKQHLEKTAATPSAAGTAKADATTGTSKAVTRADVPRGAGGDVGAGSMEEGTDSSGNGWEDAALVLDEQAETGNDNTEQTPLSQQVPEEATSSEAAARPASVEEPTGRTLNALEVARSVDTATKAKEELAKQSINRARETVQAQRAALQAKMKEQEQKFLEDERQLAQLEKELQTGCNQDERIQIATLRAQIEAGGREVHRIEQEVSSKRLAMQRATDAYINAEERLQQKKDERRKLEEKMMDLILSTGKAKDEKLTGLLMQMPDSSTRNDDIGLRAAAEESKDSSS